MSLFKKKQKKDKPENKPKEYIQPSFTELASFKCEKIDIKKTERQPTRIADSKNCHLSRNSDGDYYFRFERGEYLSSMSGSLSYSQIVEITTFLLQLVNEGWFPEFKEGKDAVQ